MSWISYDALPALKILNERLRNLLDSGTGEAAQLMSIGFCIKQMAALIGVGQPVARKRIDQILREVLGREPWKEGDPPPPPLDQPEDPKFSMDVARTLGAMVLGRPLPGTPAERGDHPPDCHCPDCLP